MSDPVRLTLVNGSSTDTVSVHDRGLSYGDGVFETMAAVDGRIRNLDAHLDRLAEGCSRLRISCPARELLVAECLAVARSVAQRVVVKLLITRGTAARGLATPSGTPPTRIVSAHPWPTHPPHWRESGVAVRWCTTRLASQPLLAGIKHLNRLEYVLARSEWSDDEIAEGLLKDVDDNVIGGTMTNLFIVKGGELLTPRLDRCGVAGTTRQAVIRVASELKIAAREARLSVRDVETAEDVFLTNSLIGVWCVVRIETRPVTCGEISRCIQQRFDY